MSKDHRNPRIKLSKLKALAKLNLNQSENVRLYRQIISLTGNQAIATDGVVLASIDIGHDAGEKTLHLRSRTLFPSTRFLNQDGSPEIPIIENVELPDYKSIAEKNFFIAEEYIEVRLGIEPLKKALAVAESANWKSIRLIISSKPHVNYLDERNHGIPVIIQEADDFRHYDDSEKMRDRIFLMTERDHIRLKELESQKGVF